METWPIKFQPNKIFSVSFSRDDIAYKISSIRVLIKFSWPAAIKYF